MPECFKNHQIVPKTHARPACSSPAAQSYYDNFKTYKKFCALTGKKKVVTIMVVFVLYCCIDQSHTEAGSLDSFWSEIHIKPDQI